MDSILVDKQVKQFTKRINDKTELRVGIRYDDQCKNGHNTFSITCDEFVKGKLESCGQNFNLITRWFPELSKYIKWHLMSSNEPLHYIANTIFWAKNAVNGGDKSNYTIFTTKERCYEATRSCAIWPDAEESDLLPDPTDDQNNTITFNNLTTKLVDRLPQLIEDFKLDLAELGLTF